MRFLIAFVLVASLGLSAWAQGVNSRALATRPQASRAYLELSGVAVGMLRSASGGNVVADVVAERAGAGKRLGRVRYEPFVLETGPAMTPEFWKVLQNGPGSAPLDGAVVLVDFNQKVLKRLEFVNARVTEIALPALDAAASKETASLLVTLVPDMVRVVPGSGTAPSFIANKARPMLASNFRLSIDGLDTTRVNKIDALVLKQVAASLGNADRRDLEQQLKKKAESGERREFAPETMAPDVSDLVFFASMVGVGSLEKWFESFVVRGNNAASEEKTGKLELLSPDLQTVLLTITLRGLGIYRLAPAGDFTEARLYVESITIESIK